MSALPLIVSHFARAHWRGRMLHGARLARWQNKRAQQIVRYAQGNAPFYRAHWRDHDLSAWQTLPTIDKAQMMAHFDTFTTCGVNRERALAVALQAERSRDFAPTLDGLTVGLSSGTSGHRGLFIVSAQEQAAWAGTILARAMPRLRRGGTRVAFFLRSNSNLYERVHSRVVQFRYFDLMLPLDQAIRDLNRYQPHIVVAPPSLLDFLADAQEQTQLQIAPERFLSVAEVLEPQVKDRISTVFMAPVHQIYQCTEGLLAISCMEGSLHIQEDIVALQVEPVGGDTERVMPIVTDLWRTTQPIIRYRLNDVLQLDRQPCACGSDWRVLKAVEGRSDDVCFFQTHNGTTRPFFPDTIRRMVLLSSPQIKDYQATQMGTGQLTIYLDVADDASFDAVAADVRANVHAIVAQYGCRSPELQIVTGIPPTPPGVKRRRVQRQHEAP